MSHKVSSCEVAVVGGGAIGAACARAAALRGLGVAVFEPGPDPKAASPASAGMLAAQIEPPDEWSLSFGIRGRDLYHDLARALHETTGIDVALRPEGIASVGFDAAAAEHLQDIVARQRQAGLRADWLEPAELHERFPGAAPGALGALFAPEDGALDPAALRLALLADARRLGAALIPEAVGRVVIEGARVAGVATAAGATAARHVVVAAGAWSPSLDGLPRPLAVEPVRGQLAATRWPAQAPHVILYHEHTYVLGRGDEAIAGSTMERAGFDARVTDAGLAQIFRGAVRLLPALAALPVQRAWAGLRPVTPDGRPILGPDPDVEGLWYATGHGRNGILLAALTGEIISDLLSRGATEVDIAPLRVNRRFLTPDS